MKFLVLQGDMPTGDNPGLYDYIIEAKNENVAWRQVNNSLTTNHSTEFMFELTPELVKLLEKIGGNAKKELKKK